MNNVYASLDGSMYAKLADSSGLQSLRENQTGTFVAWTKIDSSLAGEWKALIGAGSGGGSGIRGGGYSDFGFGATNGAIAGSLQINGDRSRIQSSSPYDWGSSEVIGNWVCYASTWDTGNGEFYIAVPSDDYSVTNTASVGTVTGSTPDWDGPVSLSNDDDQGGNDGEEWPGDVDISFFDDIAWTESEIQDWVDDTRGLYE